MNSQVWWFVARSSGIVAWALLSVGVCWGLWLSTTAASARLGPGARRGRRLRATPSWVLATHRHLGGLAVIFTAIHVVGLVADSYVHFGWAEILVPMASEWEPGAVAFGIVGFYLLLAIEATSLAMTYLPRHVWRWIHRSSFVLYATATYHGIAAGTDASNQWFRLAAWASVIAVVALTLRLLLVLRRAERTAERDVAVRPTAPTPAPLAVGSAATWAPPTSVAALAPPPVPVPVVPPAVVTPAPRPLPVPTGRPQRPPLVPSGAPATAPLFEMPTPDDFAAADEALVNAGGGGADAPERPPAAT